MLVQEWKVTEMERNSEKEYNRKEMDKNTHMKY